MQLDLFNEAEALAVNAPPAREDTPGTKVAGICAESSDSKPLDPNLPCEIVRRELPEAKWFFTNDGHALVEVGVETSVQFEVIPGQIRVIELQPVTRPHWTQHTHATHALA